MWILYDGESSLLRSGLTYRKWLSQGAIGNLIVDQCIRYEVKVLENCFPVFAPKFCE